MTPTIAIQCAWCRRVKGEDDQWHLTDYPPTLVSHGICPSCKDDTLQELRAIGRRPEGFTARDDEGNPA